MVPDLAAAIAEARDLDAPTRAELDETYRTTLVLLYRLLFVAYAEDRGFLQENAEGSLAETMREPYELRRTGGEFDDDSTALWDGVLALTRAIRDGRGSGRPAYGGRLLAEDPETSEAGAELARLELTDERFGPILRALLLDEPADGDREPVDFRNVDVGEFGAIHQELLGSRLSVADRPLRVERTNGERRYVPADPDAEEVAVSEGEIHLRGRSGERKTTGSYYTRTRFVEHLLDHALEPALDDHLDRLDGLDESAAAAQFFDVRVADVAMGTGRFLVAAVDRIAARLRAYLAERTLSGVEAELDRLEEIAVETFDSGPPAVDRGRLLRRQVARRCLYGVDVDDHATDLARLSLWLHTFVPGLPLTQLDHALRTGDSLAGIGRIDEIGDAPGASDDVMAELREAIDRAGDRADAAAERGCPAAEIRRTLRADLERPRAAFDVFAAARVDDDLRPDVASGDPIGDGRRERARELLAPAEPFHFPAAFPEVFGGAEPGFDVVVGNPPWEKAKVERHEFWARHYPGIRGLTQTDREERIATLETRRPDLVAAFREERAREEARARLLTEGPYPDIGSGDPDTYVAFAWRFRDLAADGGYVGALLPRSAFVGPATETFRRRLLDASIVHDLTFLVNDGRWIFPGVHSQYTVALIGFEKRTPPEGTRLPLRGPYPDADSFEAGVDEEPRRFDRERARNWTDGGAFPLLPPVPAAADVFGEMARHPRLDADGDWAVTPATELHTTRDKTDGEGTRLMRFTDDPPDGHWPIFKGGSFHVWNPDTGVRYGWADPDAMLAYLQEKRGNSYDHAGSRSPFSEMPEEWIRDADTLPCLEPRIAFRDVARSTDTRTAIPALLPPETFLVETAPYFLRSEGDRRDEAYLLGVMSSIPFDWYVRRFVETHLKYHILNALPVPRPGRDDSRRRRVVEIAGRLAAVDERYAEWAAAVGVDYGPVAERRKRRLVHELDAVVAHAYGLDRAQLRVVFETFHDGWDHDSRLTAVLEHYDAWADGTDDRTDDAEPAGRNA